MDRALIWFLAWMGIMVMGVIITIPLPSLSNYIMYFIVICYVVAGVGASALSGFGAKKIGKHFGLGVLAILQALLMILLAASVKYILYETNVMYALLYYSIQTIRQAPSGLAVLLIYGAVLVFDFFIPSGSAKAALLMPTIYPIADILNINRQTTVLAFAFGDAFSNVIFPTNPVLLIALGLTVVSYVKWFRWSIKLQLILFALTVGMLLFAHNFVYI